MTTGRALAALWALSLGSAALAALEGAAPGGALFAVVLGLAWIKARVILGAYLDLRAAPAWLSGFSTAFGLLCAFYLALWFIPAA